MKKRLNEVELIGLEEHRRAIAENFGGLSMVFDKAVSYSEVEIRAMVGVRNSGELFIVPDRDIISVPDKITLTDFVDDDGVIVTQAMSVDLNGTVLIVFLSPKDYYVATTH